MLSLLGNHSYFNILQIVKNSLYIFLLINITNYLLFLFVLRYWHLKYYYKI